MDPRVLVGGRCLEGGPGESCCCSWARGLLEAGRGEGLLGMREGFGRPVGVSEGTGLFEDQVWEGVSPPPCPSLFSSPPSMPPVLLYFCHLFCGCCPRDKAPFWSPRTQGLLHHWAFSFILSGICSPSFKGLIVSLKRWTEVSPHAPEEGPFLSLGWKVPEGSSRRRFLC